VIRNSTVMVVKRTCFFIDDNSDNLALFTRALSAVSPETICFVANNGRDAITLMLEEHVVPSCIFMKEFLRDWDAEDFVRILRSSRMLKDVPVIVHGTHLSEDNVTTLKELGVKAIFTKPFTFLGVSNMLRLYFHPDLTVTSLN
jgi:CheY-like chemotaxis protein